MAKITLYAAKVNVHEHIFALDLQEIISNHIPRVVLEAPSIKLNTYTWSFTDVKQELLGKDRFITGNVTKSKVIPFKARIGSETIEVTPEHEQAKTSYFAYHPESEILTYEVNSIITDEDFRKVFTKLLSRDPYIGEVKIIPFPEPYKIRNEINAMDKVTSINFHLIHPNPGKKEFNLYQEIIHQSAAKEVGIKITNSTGLIIKDPSTELASEYVPTIENGIQMVENGYGSIVIRGYNEIIVPGSKKQKIKKRTRNFSSHNAIRKITVNEYGEETLLSRIRSFILDIINKVKNKD